jgi:hypothetical protein
MAIDLQKLARRLRQPRPADAPRPCDPSEALAAPGSGDPVAPGDDPVARLDCPDIDATQLAGRPVILGYEESVGLYWP